VTISGVPRRLPLAFTSAVLMLAGAPGTAAAEPLTDYDGYRVAAHDGRQAWSHRLDDGRFELLLRENGGVRALAVRPQPRPYDVALGRDARGNPIAVYAWCPSASSPGRCRLRMIDLASGRDRAVPGTHAAGASEYLPALSNGRLMFARRGRRTDAQGHHIVSVRIKRLGTRRPARVLRRAFLLDVVGTALSPRGAAFAVVDFARGRGENKLYARRAGGRITLVARSRLGTNMFQTSPRFRRGVLYWGASDLTATPAAGHVLRCRDHRVRAARTRGTVTSVAADPVAGGAPLVVSLRMDTGAQVATLRPAGWGAPPRDVIVRRCPF
jgi:hypothetical protein